MLLISLDCSGLFVWHRMTPPEERDAKGPEKRRKERGNAPSPYAIGDASRHGIMCSVFRNEGPLRSSDLILEAEDLAWRRWPGQRLFTYVWPAKLKPPEHKYRKPKVPGKCFIAAGWRTCGRNADGRLIILEKMPP